MGAYITETWLRECFSLGHGTEIQLPAESRLTPAAQGLLNERRILVKYVGEESQGFLDGLHAYEKPELKRVNPLTSSSERHEAHCQMCHQIINKKPDTMTHLNKDTFVAKNDPRLKLRGKLDSAIAQVVLIHEEFDPEGRFFGLAQWLADIRSALGNVLKAEVTDETLATGSFGDMDAEMIHAVSHNPLKYLGHDHMVPEKGYGLRVARLNLLRAQIREAELYAADVYIARDFTVTRPDIMKGLNRLSSAVYVFMLLTHLAEQGKPVPTEGLKA